MAERRHLLIAAGGTGGHILPGIRIGRQIEAENGGLQTVSYICGSRYIESCIYTAEGVEPMRLSMGGGGSKPLSLQYFFQLLTDLFTLVNNYLSRRPGAILAMGGAVCFPVLLLAVLFRIPIFLHESNRVPGRVVRLFAPFARRVFLGLGGLERSNALVTGTPTKECHTNDTEREIVLCVGGSQGAARLNEYFVAASNRDEFRKLDCHFVLISGPGKTVQGAGGVEVREYEPHIESLLSRARLVVARSGAGTLADISNFRVPSILVPYPYAKDDHQTANARVFSDAGAAILMEEKTLTTERLAEAMHSLLADEAGCAAMREKLRAFDSSRAASIIAHEIVESLQAGQRRAPASPHAGKAIP